MKKNKKQKTMQETLSSLDAVLAALSAYPNLEDALLEKAQGELNKYMGQLFPTQLDFAKDILEHLVGTDVLIEIISKFLTVALPGVEVSMKTALLANMQNLGTNCTIDPFIYEKAIKEGVIFDLRQIDLYDKLTVSPLDKKIGQYYYFGIEDCESSYDVLQSAIDPNNQTDKQKKDKNGNPKKVKEGTSYMKRAMTDSVGHYFGFRKRDFDCLLWYMKNKSVTRQVWGKRTSESEGIFNDDSGEGIEKWVKKKGKEGATYYTVNEDGKGVTLYTKISKDEVQKREGKTVPVEKGNEYYYTNGNSYFVYKWGNASITKLSRKQKYCVRNGRWSYVTITYNDKKGIWDKDDGMFKSYKSFEDIPADGSIKDDMNVIVNGSLYLIKEIKTKEETRTNKEGVEYKINVVSKLKTDSYIDITNGVKGDTTLYVDYDEIENGRTKKEIINDDESDELPTSTLKQLGFVNECKNGQSWFKKRVSKKTDGLLESSDDLYYVDNDSEESSNDDTKSFTVGVDKLLIAPFNKDGEFVTVSAAKEKNNKYTKDFGVLTLEYSPRTGNVLQSDGKPLKQQTPYDNVLHVFFGNVKELPDQVYNHNEEVLRSSSEVNKKSQNVMKTMKSTKKKHLKIFNRKNDEWKKRVNPTEKQQFVTAYQYYNLVTTDTTLITNKGKVGETTYYSHLPVDHPLYNDINGLGAKVDSINTIVNTFLNSIYTGEKGSEEYDYDTFKDFRKSLNEILKVDEKSSKEEYYSIYAFIHRIGQIMDTNESALYLSARGFNYPDANKNYYYKRTLFEFNADYINSLQLFDPKVLAAQLITSLFTGATISAMIGATASWKTELIRDVVKDMVLKQIAAEDFAVSDCFFTFSNDAYNGMLRAAELRQAGLYSQHGEENGNNKIDPVKLLEGLNEIDNCADQAGQTEVIKGVITEASGEVCKDVYKENNYLAVNTNFGIQMSFIETLMINLCTQLVMAILSPKVYLLILINLEMFGLSTNFSLKAFLERFEALIRSIIKSIVDQFMQYITQEIMKIIEELMQKLIVKLSFEQVEMYARLLKQIFMHLRMLTSCGQGVGWTQDMVGYADIVNNESQEPIDEC